MDGHEEAIRFAAARLTATLSLAEPRMRTLAAERALLELDAGDIVLLLAALQRNAAQSARAGDALAVVVGALHNDLPLARRTEIALAARARGETLVASLVRGPESQRSYHEGQETHVDIRIESMTLGHRRALARTRDKDLLARLAHDKDPGVVHNLLANPMLTESDVVRIAARRPARGEVLTEIFRSPRWGTSRAVRRALALNPYTPVELALRAVSLLLVQDCAQVASDSGLHPAVRMAALERRRGRKGA